MRQSKIQKREIIIIKYYIYLVGIVTATERGDRGDCHIGYPSLTFQNPEEVGNKPPKRRILNKKVSYNYPRGEPRSELCVHIFGIILEFI